MSGIGRFTSRGPEPSCRHDRAGQRRRDHAAESQHGPGRRRRRRLAGLLGRRGRVAGRGHIIVVVQVRPQRQVGEERQEEGNDGHEPLVATLPGRGSRPLAGREERPDDQHGAGHEREHERCDEGVSPGRPDVEAGARRGALQRPPLGSHDDDAEQRDRSDQHPSAPHLTRSRGRHVERSPRWPHTRSDCTVGPGPVRCGLDLRPAGPGGSVARCPRTPTTSSSSAAATTASSPPACSPSRASEWSCSSAGTWSAAPRSPSSRGAPTTR